MGISGFIIIPHQMLNRLMFYKPMGPNQPQIGTKLVSINSNLPVQSEYKVVFLTEVNLKWTGMGISSFIPH